MFIIVNLFYFLSEFAFQHLKRLHSAESNESTNNRSSSNKNILVAQVSYLSDPTKSGSVKHLSFKPSPSEQYQTKDYCALVPTAAESLFPWRRDRSYQSLSFGI